MAELVARFVTAFKRGIEGEVAAMRASTKAFEIPLTDGEDLGALRYRFATTERIATGTVCALQGQRVTIEKTDGAHVTLVASGVIEVTAECALVVAPWFLYDRLVQALDTIANADLPFTLFGKTPAMRVATTLACKHDSLDPSQRAAVQLCAESNLAFVWGPPGTGKTVTLVQVIEELLARGERILLASTTNAAIDQVLAKLSTRPWFAPGTFVRLGRSDADTFGTELADIVERMDDARARLRMRVGVVEQQLRYARELVTELMPAVSAQQSLFGESPRLRAASLAPLFTANIAELDARAQLRVVEQRIARLERVRVLAKARLAASRDLETRVVGEARVVLCTLANTYLSPLLVGQKFDVLIAEEAGMATLPTLFYAASLCERRAIMVGDPRQLPPIVQSDDSTVARIIGRTIFEVSGEPVAMLQEQYRMHPAIGSLVGGLFYDGKLIHRATDTDVIAARAPFPGEAVKVVDTRGACERKGTSRFNVISAEVTANLAHEAVRGGSTSIAVITPYAAQAIEIRKLLAARRIADVVECSTVHRFQGRECDVVIVDMVDAPPLRASALLDANLLNVSISRARGKLVIVADVAHFTDGIVAALLTSARKHQRD